MKKYIFAWLAVIAVIFTFTACGEDSSSIEGIRFCRKSGYSLSVGSSDAEYVYVTGGNVKEGDIIFVSEDDSVADITATSFSTALVGYSVVAVDEGETYVYAVSADGLIFSEKIKVTVTKDFVTYGTDTESETETESEIETFRGSATQLPHAYAEPETTAPTSNPTDTQADPPATSEATTESSHTETTAEPTVKSISASAEKDAEEPDETVYIINTESKKIHRQSCYAAARIKDENRSEVSSVEELLSSGYEWCLICK